MKNGFAGISERLGIRCSSPRKETSGVSLAPPRAVAQGDNAGAIVARIGTRRGKHTRADAPGRIALSAIGVTERAAAHPVHAVPAQTLGGRAAGGPVEPFAGAAPIADLCEALIGRVQAAGDE